MIACMYASMYACMYACVDELIEHPSGVLCMPYMQYACNEPSTLITSGLRREQID
jgi:hypothetical protein